jgi:hypothetical protein
VRACFARTQEREMPAESDYQSHAMPNQPPGMTLRTRTNVKTNSRSVNRDSTFEVEYTPDLDKLTRFVRDTLMEERVPTITVEMVNARMLQVIEQRIRDANNFLIRESFRATNIREDKELQAMGIPRRWEDDGLTPRPGSSAKFDE